MGEARASPLERIAPAAIKRVKKSRRCIGSNQCFPSSGTPEVQSGFVHVVAPPRYSTMYHTRILRGLRSQIRCFRVSESQGEIWKNSSERRRAPFQVANDQPVWEEVQRKAPRGHQGIGLLRVARDKTLVAGKFLAPVPVPKRILPVDTDNVEGVSLHRATAAWRVHTRAARLEF